MKISRSSDYSINFEFNNMEVDLCYPLIRFSLDNLAIKLDTEISYYKFSTKELFSDSVNLINVIDYVFTFKLLGLGFIVTYSVKDHES